MKLKPLDSKGAAHYLVPLLAVMVVGIVGSYLIVAGHANPNPENCFGYNGRKFNGQKEYGCHFPNGAPVRDADGYRLGGISAGYHWVLCQQQGVTARDGNSYNSWWAYTQSDGGTMGWVSALAGADGSNDAQFRYVPHCQGSHGSAPSAVHVVSSKNTDTGQAILHAALAQRGLPYVWDAGNVQGPTSGGFDCSGLVLYAVYQATGKTLVHQSQYQWTHSKQYGADRIPESNLQPGDIVYFPGSDGTASQPGHVGIYYGRVNGKQAVVDAYGSGVPVKIHTFDQETGGFSGALRF